MTPCTSSWSIFPGRGGLTEGRKIASMAATYHRPFAAHDCIGPISYAAAIHMAFSQPNTLIQESVRAFYTGYYRELVTVVPGRRQWIHCPDGRRRAWHRAFAECVQPEGFASPPRDAVGAPAAQRHPMTVPNFDVILRNGLVVDGTGRPGFVADIAIIGDRIAKIGSFSAGNAAMDIDVGGLVVSPGFIDVHTHDDAALIVRPEMTAKLTQGVTTVMGGNCGISAAPYDRQAAPPGLLRLVFKSDHCTGLDLRRLRRQGARGGYRAVNAGFLTGHCTLRMQVMGDDLERPATPGETDQMKQLLAGCLQQGSFGLSTGLYYPPARSATTDEVIGVAAALREFGGMYASHIRDEADHVVESLEEALLIGREAGVSTVVSHHKCMGQRNFGRSVENLGAPGRRRDSADRRLGCLSLHCGVDGAHRGSGRQVIKDAGHLVRPTPGILRAISGRHRKDTRMHAARGDTEATNLPVPSTS